MGIVADEDDSAVQSRRDEGRVVAGGEHMAHAAVAAIPLRTLQVVGEHCAHALSRGAELAKFLAERIADSPDHGVSQCAA